MAQLQATVRAYPRRNAPTLIRATKPQGKPREVKNNQENGISMMDYDRKKGAILQGLFGFVSIEAMAKTERAKIY
jgi:hypothetical protein